MRLHFYTGIAMSVLAADYAAKAVSVDGETALDTMASDAETNYYDVGATNELSQNEIENELLASPVKKAPKVIKKPVKKAAPSKPVIKKTTKAAPKTATKPPKIPVKQAKKVVPKTLKKPAALQRAKAAAAVKK